MPSKKISEKTPKETTKNELPDLKYSDLAEVCEAAAYRISVVVDLVRHIKDRPLDEDNDGGWSLRTAIEVLENVRNDLLKGADAELARIQERPQPMKGGA